MKRDKNTGINYLKQLIVPLGAPPTYRAAVLLLCVTAGCADVDTHTSVTHEAVTITTIPVTGAVGDPETDGSFGPMVALADFNGDGNVDMAASNNHNAVSVRLGDGAGGFGAERLFNLNLLVGRPEPFYLRHEHPPQLGDRWRLQSGWQDRPGDRGGQILLGLLLPGQRGREWPAGNTAGTPFRQRSRALA